MGVSTFTAASLGIVATFIIDDLNVSRATLGLVIAVNSGVAALLSPSAGRVTDRVGGKAALIGLFLITTVAFAMFGLASVVILLFAGAAVGAVAQSGANPSTNKLIAGHLAPGDRGIVTGIKQSGVQAGIFLGGLTLPSLALVFGWRPAYFMVALIPAFFAIGALVVLPRDAPSVEHREERNEALPSVITWIAVYGFLMGFAGAVTFLVPLFAEEGLGLDPRVGGLAAATVGFVAFVSRIAWARRSERIGDFWRPLLAMAILAAASSLVLLASEMVAPWLLWPGVVLIGASSSAWNSVGMLAVMDTAGTARTGRASGIVLLGFLGGLAFGPPIYGAIVDRSGSYAGIWVLSAIVAALATLLVAYYRMGDRSERLSHS